MSFADVMIKDACTSDLVILILTFDFFDPKVNGFPGLMVEHF